MKLSIVKRFGLVAMLAVALVAVGNSVTTSTAFAGEGDACAPFRAGSLTPQVVLMRDDNDPRGFVILCGSIPNVVGAPYGPDIPMEPSNKVVDIPSGYMVDGDVVIGGVFQATGGVSGERMVVIHLCPRGCKVIPAYGGDAMPGGANEAVARCVAKFITNEKRMCAITDPELGQ